MVDRLKKGKQIRVEFRVHCSEYFESVTDNKCGIEIVFILKYFTVNGSRGDDCNYLWLWLIFLQRPELLCSSEIGLRACPKQKSPITMSECSVFFERRGARKNNENRHQRKNYGDYIHIRRADILGVRFTLSK